MSRRNEFILFESRHELSNWVGIVQDSKCDVKVLKDGLILDASNIDTLMSLPMYEILNIEIIGKDGNIEKFVSRIGNYIA